jgi:hypothetical protein
METGELSANTCWRFSSVGKKSPHNNTYNSPSILHCREVAVAGCFHAAMVHFKTMAGSADHTGTEVLISDGAKFSSQA